MTTPNKLLERRARAAAHSRHPNPLQRPGSGWAAVARWLLLAAVITGVLAMHILSAADSAGSHQPMAMTPAAATPPAMAISMSMSMPAVNPAPPTSRFTAQLSGGPGAGMSPMSCCVLFLIAAAALILLIRSTKPASTAATGGVRGRAAPSAVTQRGPPGPGRPRIALSILRV